jgi:membrane protease YdiL (CAAX protease family)
MSYPDLRQTFILFGVYLAVFFAVYIVSETIIPSDVSDVVYEWASLCIYVASIAPVLFFARMASKTPGFDCGMTGITWTTLRKIPFELLFILVFTVPAMIVVNEAIVSLIPMSEEIEESFANMVTPSLPSFLTVVVAAPVLEELLCRGIVLRGLLSHLSPYKAVAYSALFFAVMHLNPWQGIAAFIIGCVSGAVYCKTRSILPSIFIHLLNNVLCFSAFFLSDHAEATLNDILGDAYIFVVILSLIVFAAGLHAIHSTLKHRYPEESRDAEEIKKQDEEIKKQDEEIKKQYIEELETPYLKEQ